MKLEPWILTHQGVEFSLSDPRIEDVRIEDIAHNLARIRRFNGATDQNCSVALHCVVASHIVPLDYAKAAFLHDAAEAYIGDIIGPIKWMLGDPIKQIEDKILNLIYKKFNVDRWLEKSQTVRRADLECLKFERENFMPECDREWEILENIDYPTKANYWLKWYVIHNVEAHERIYLDRAKELGLG